MATSGTKLSPQATKARIIDAAEELFVSSGFDAMSMRQITASAGVNLAAVNYHFGSKDALIQVVLARRLDPLNDARVAMLDQFETNLGDQVTCEHLLTAMFLPALRMFDDAVASGRYLQFVGRAYTDPSNVVRDFLNERYINTLGRFFMAFQRALPDLPRDDLGFRLHFAMGALAGVLAGGNTQRLIRDFTQGEYQETLLLLRLASLLVAALRAPLPSPDDVDAFGKTFGLLDLQPTVPRAQPAQA